MDELDAFFDCTTPLVRKTISGGTTNGRIVSAPEPQSSDRSSEFDSSSNYAQPHKEENDSILLASFASEAANRDGVKHNPFDSSDDDDDDGIDPIYLQYNFNKRSTNQNLPITFYKLQILCAIKENPFLILQGATGCGKTTQVPQFILDEACAKQKRCNIVVAQPRRIASVSNAERVAHERSWPPTTVVGYQIGMDEKKNCSEDTRILFCTTGVLLEKLIRRRDFLNYTHIILDEVHECNKDMDFLFIVIRRLFATTLPKPKVKIILMSATIDARLFANYFTIPKNGVLVPAPIVLVEQKSKFTVSEFYLESFCSVAPDLEKIKFNFEEPGIPAHMYTLALCLINRCEHIDVREKLTSADHALDKQRLSRPTRNPKFMRFSSSVQNQSTNSEDFLKYDTDPSAQFMRRDNRVLLRSLTHMQKSKVFQPHQVPFNRNSYQFLTVAELKTKFEGALRAARRMLLMPPIIPIESDAIEVISKDPALQGFTENKFVFTDTSFNLNDKERTIIVRQPNGVLETADPVTRRRMNQIYFPREGRKLAIPRMFNGEHLQRTLDEGKYIFVLNRAAIQFEPYDKDYHRVTSVTYQHINDHSAFECLRSTRHFGPFAFFLAWHRLIDALLIDCIRRDYLRNAVEAICLMYNIHNLPYDGYILEQLKRYPNRDDEYYYRKLIEGNDKENENDKSNEIQFEIEKTVGKNSHDLQVETLFELYRRIYSIG